jgi:very-short-patch-repair endonuclease
MTDAEQRIWVHLRAKRLAGFKFRRQHRMGRYVVDFVCPDARLVVELDGGQHLERQTYDAERTAYLESLGYRVLRFWNDDVLVRTHEVLEVILRALRD